MHKAALAIPAAMLVAAAGPVAGDGYLAGPSLPGFAIVSSGGDARGAIVEQVPRGETAKNWTRKITTRRFTGLAATVNPPAYLAMFARHLAETCRGARTDPPESLTVSGRPAAKMRADCPVDPQTHGPEAVEILAIAGPRDIHTKEVAFGYLPDPTDIAWADNYLSSIAFCLPMSKAPDCRIVAPE